MNAVKDLRSIRTEYGLSGNADKVLDLARPLIQSGNITKAGDEAWDIYEQTLIAAAEASDDTLALTCLTRLSDKFPQSGRVHALRGMMLEVTQSEQETLKFYNNVLNTEPTNVPIIKRRITYTKSLGKVVEAISLLVSYLDVYYTDAEAWAELARYYSELGQFDKAAFCCSETVLLTPHDHAAQATYADALLAQHLQESDQSLLHAATRTYLRSIELCDSYIRGFCGVKVCCNKLLSISATDASRPHEKRLPVATTSSEDMLDVANVKALDLMSTKFLSSLSNVENSRETPDVSSFVKDLLAVSRPVR